MKKYLLYIACTIIASLVILSYAFGFSALTGLFSEQPTVAESHSSASNKTFTSNLDSIPNYIEPEEIKSTLTSEQKKQYSNLNETQQKEVLSAMGHAQSIQDVVTYGSIELDRLQELDKDIAQQDKQAEAIIRSLNAQVRAKEAERENLDAQ